MIAEQLKPKKKRSRQERRVAETRRKLLAAARSVFAEKGMDLARIDEITERADVGKGTFYCHFRSKPQLIRELVKDVLNDLASLVERRCEGVGELNPLMDAMIGAHIEFFCGRWEDFVLYYQARTDLTLEEGYPGIETPVFDYLVRLEHLLESVIKRKVSAKVLRRISCAVAGFVSGYFSFAVVASRDDDVDAVFQSLRGAMVASLARFVQEAAPAQA